MEKVKENQEVKFMARNYLIEAFVAQGNIQQADAILSEIEKEVR